MKIDVEGFQGEYPRVGNQLLPASAATVAENVRLLSGNLTTWNGFEEESTLCKVGEINSVYLMDDQYWLHWTEAELGAGQTNVDAVRGPVAQDTTARTIFTGTDVPRVTNIDLATDGVAECYPYDSYKLGVPAPEDAPTLVVNGSEDLENEIDVENRGAEEGDTSGWFSTGSFAAYDNNDIVGQVPHSGNFFFGSGNVASTTFYQDILLGESGAASGQELTLSWWQASGAGGSLAFMDIVFLDEADIEIGRIEGVNQAITPANTWEQQTIVGGIVSGTDKIRIYGELTRVGGTMDAYIDDIQLLVTNSDFSNDGSDLTPFQISPQQSARTVQVVDLGTDHGDVIRCQADEKTNYLYKNFALTNAASFTMQYDVSMEHRRNEHHLVIGATASGVGQGICFPAGADTKPMQRRTFSTLDDRGSGSIEIDAAVLTMDTWYTIFVVGTKSGDSTFKCLVSARNNNTLVYTATDIEVDLTLNGDFINWKHWSNEGGGTARTYFDNIQVSTTPSITSEEGSATFTSYVYTFVNELGEEGPPSPVSEIVTLPDGGSIVVTSVTSYGDPEYAIVSKRIYRAVTGSTGTDFQFVEEIPLAQEEYVDNKDDDELGEVLGTVDWDLPPTDGQGVIALPNGVTAMFSKNQLCPSVINYPHAYPELYRLAFEEDIVAIAAIDTSIVVGTRSYPYLVLGSDPSQMSSAKFEQRQSCVSKRSMVSIRGFGVVYASPDGLVAINAAGGLQLITDNFMSRREWQGLNPSSIIAFVHDDRYYGFYNNGSDGGFIFDPREGGNGLTFLDLGFGVQAGFSDPVTDILYLYFDDALQKWDMDDENPLTMTWQSKEYQLPRPANFRAAQIRGTFDGTTPITFKVYANNVLIYTKTVTTEMEFVLPPNQTTQLKFSVEGVPPEIRKISVAEEMGELE